jgi:hypothetical protein
VACAALCFGAFIDGSGSACGQDNAGRVGVRSGAGFHDWDEARLARVKEGRKRVIERGTV